MSRTLQEWQAARRAELASPDSWLGLVGLFWLAPGSNRVGCGEDCAVRLPSGPDCLGELDWQEDRVFWRPVDGEARELETDRAGSPTAVDHENLSFFIVDREGRLAVRLRDRDWMSSRPFAGLAYYPEAPEWQVEADWVEVDPPLSMEVPTVSGELKMVEVGRKAVFERDGQRVELLPMSVGEREVFFVFRDRTSGRETYGAGRFLKAKPAVDGRIRLDFNRAFNPPCAFTPFATCPLPPPENWLPFPVPAGERKYQSAEH
jgi:uncharacterized protein (DUF1684 family)